MKKKIMVFTSILLIGYSFHSLGSIPERASRLFKKRAHPIYKKSEYLPWYERGVVLQSLLLGTTGILLLHSGLNFFAEKRKDQN